MSQSDNYCLGTTIQKGGKIFFSDHLNSPRVINKLKLPLCANDPFDFWSF